MTGEPILELDNLSKRYGKRFAVRDLCLEVRRGDIYGFLGHNGAGKSTSIRMVMGMVHPTGGEVRVAGHKVRAGRHHAHWPVGAIIESPIFYDYLSARLNLEMLSSLSGGATKERIDSIIDLVGLTPRQHEQVKTFSHGMRQRLGLAQALLPDPELIILDEPLDGLDPRGIREMRDVMLRVVAEGRVTIFLSSHILTEVELTCNRVGVIHQGRRLYEGTVKDLVRESDRVRLRTAGGEVTAEKLKALEFVDDCQPHADGGWLLRMHHDSVPRLNRELVGSNVDVLELSPLKNRLEDVFLDLTGDRNPYEEDEVPAA